MSDIRNLVNQMVSRYMGSPILGNQSSFTLPAVNDFSSNDLSVGADEYARKHKPAAGQLGLFEKPEERQKPLFSKKVDDEAGRWVTMRGARVYISSDDGRVLKGPKRLMGKTKEQIERESAGKGEGTEKPPMPKGLAEMGRIKGGRKDNRQKGLFEEINPGFKWDEDEDVKTVQPAPSPAVQSESSYEQQILKGIQDKLKSGESVTLATNTKATKFDARHVDMFRVKGGKLQVQQGKNWNTVDFDPLHHLASQVGVERPGSGETFEPVDYDSLPSVSDSDDSILSADFVADYFNGDYGAAAEAMELNRAKEIKRANELGVEWNAADIDDEWMKEVAGQAESEPVRVTDEPFSLSGGSGLKKAKPATFNNTESTKQGALFDSGKGKGDLPGQELLFNSDAGDLGNPKTMENRVQVAPRGPYEWKENKSGKKAWFKGETQITGAFVDDSWADEAARQLPADADGKPAPESDFKDHPEFERLQSVYGHLSNDEIKNKIEEMTGEIASLQKAGRREFNMNGGRRTSAAVSAEGARNVGQEKLLLGAYLKHREKNGEDGPQDGDRDATGLVFRDGRWHRDDEGEGEGDKSSQSPAESGKKRGFTVERMNRATGKMEGVSFDIGEPVDVFLSNEKYTSGRLAHVSKDGQTVSVEFDGVRGKYRSKHHIGTIYKPGTLKGSDTSLKSIQKSTKPKYTLAKAVSDVNEKHGEGLTEADRVPMSPAESIQSHLDNDDHESAFEAFSKLKKDEVDKVARQVLGMGFYNKSKAQMLESLKRTLPLATKTASQAAQKKEEIDYAEMKLRKAKENQKLQSEGMMGAPIRPGVPEIAYTDPHGEGRAEAAKAWQAEVDDAQRELDRAKGVKSADDEGPQEGDVDATGLVFRNGRWHRDDEEETASADSSPSPAVDEPKSLEAKPEPQPEQKPTSTYSGSFNPETHGDYKAFMDLKKKINAGELTVDEFKQAHKFYVDNKDAFTADLAKRYDAKTLRNIAGNLGDWRAIRGENKKGENADSVYSSMMQHAFDIGKGISNVYSGDEAREGLSKAALRRLADHVEKQTAESLAEHIADRAKSKAEWDEAQKANDEAAANPKTLSDFELTLKRSGGYDKLKPEQQELYDELMSEKTRSGREEEKRPTVVEAKVSGDHGGFELTKNFHSKRGQDIFTASPKNRVERDEYDKMNTAAKRLGGWYYKQFGSTPGGFHFPDEEKRNKFLRAMAGEKVDRSDILAEKDQSKGEAKAEKLSDLADRMEQRAKESLGRDRKDNTARRARMADSAIASAEHELNQSARLKSIAAAIESGEAKHLKGLNSLTQLEALQRVWRQHQRQYEEHKLKEKYGDNWNRDASYSEREATYQNPVSVESASFVKMPRQIIYPSNVSKFLEQAANTPGLKQEAAKWQKIFSRNADPQDRDRGITLNKKSTEEWYEFANRAKSKGVKHDWSGFTNKDDFQRLASMGIREDHELRAAIRELAKHQNVKHGSAPAKDPVRELEKKIHREHKEAGFYPTPPKVIDRLMDLADISDNHDVLEPSAGSGRIMDAIKAAHGDSVKLKGVEHHSTLNELLKMKGHDVDHGDFLEHKGSYDRIVMNPPFENDQAIDHVKHALSLLKPGGRIVAVIPGNERTYRDASRNKRKEFAALVDQHGGHFEEMPEGSFKGSDVDRETGVNTSIVVLHKPGAEKYSRLQMYEIARDVADKYVRESVEVVAVDRYAHPLVHAAVGGLGHMAVQSLVKNTTLRRIAHAAVASAMAAWMASANAQNPSTLPAVNQPSMGVSAPATPFMRQKAGNAAIDAIVNQAFQNHQKNVAAVKAGQDPESVSVPHSISNTTGARAPGVKPLKGEDEPKSANPSTSPAGNGESGDTSGKGEGFNDNEHPRHPAGAPESKGGEFAPKDGVESPVGESSSPSPRNYPDNLNKPADQQTNYSPPDRGMGEIDEPKSLEQKIAEHRMKLASQKSEPGPKASRRDDPDTSWKKAMNFGTERVQASKDAKSQERKARKQQEQQAKQQEQAVSFNPDQIEKESEASLVDGNAESDSPYDSKPKPEDFKREKDYQRALKAWKREKGAQRASITKKIAKSVVPEVAMEYELDHSELESAVNDAIAMEFEGHKRQEEARKYVTDRGYNAGRINRNEDAGKDHSSTSLDEFASEWAGLFPEIAGSDESQWVDRMWNLAKAGKQDAPSAGDENFVRKVAERLHQQKMAGEGSSFPADPGPVYGQVGDVDFTPFHRKSLAKELGLIVDRYLREQLVT